MIGVGVRLGQVKQLVTLAVLDLRLRIRADEGIGSRTQVAGHDQQGFWARQENRVTLLRRTQSQPIRLDLDHFPRPLDTWEDANRSKVDFDLDIQI